MRELFRVAEDHAPSIVFIDEIDAIGTKRFVPLCFKYKLCTVCSNKRLWFCYVPFCLHEVGMFYRPFVPSVPFKPFWQIGGYTTLKQNYCVVFDYAHTV